ncbi:hypothetical protein OEA41_009564 [Lepraria neglecta]|uniref:Uncharacterized protein n=1 Tax=Lepraria neglecta TaxID=209136 RepID=A0AAD9Z3T5_9LECA|nr:hypothetical protein OEA41_009564 [Lepraria neglecta]
MEKVRMPEQDILTKMCSQECGKVRREPSGLERSGQISLRKEQADAAGRKEQANVNPSMYPQSTIDTQPSLPFSHNQAIEALRSRCSRGSMSHDDDSPYDRSDLPTVAMPCAMSSASGADQR